MVSAAFAYSGNWQDAEDAAQAVLIRFSQRPGLFDQRKGTLGTWLKQCSSREGIRQFRLRKSQEKKHGNLAVFTLDSFASPPVWAGDQLRGEIAKLNLKEQAALRLYSLSYSGREAGKKMGGTDCFFSKNFKSGLVKLRKALEIKVAPRN